jgi:hypothetical protein
MVSLKDWADLSKLLKTAEDRGYVHIPLTEAEIEEFSKKWPISGQSKPQSIIYEVKGHKGSGYYQKFKPGWSLIAIGPSLGGEPLRLKEFKDVPKGEEWVTRKEAERVARSLEAAVGEIVFNKDAEGTVRLAEVLETDANGLPTRLSFQGHEILTKGVEGTWEKIAGQEAAARYFYDNGRVKFIREGRQSGEWRFSVMSAMKTQRLREEAARNAEKKRNEEVPIDRDFIEGIRKTAKRRAKGKEK